METFLDYSLTSPEGVPFILRCFNENESGKFKVEFKAKQYQEVYFVNLLNKTPTLNIEEIRALSSTKYLETLIQRACNVIKLEATLGKQSATVTVNSVYDALDLEIYFKNIGFIVTHSNPIGCQSMRDVKISW